MHLKSSIDLKKRLFTFISFFMMVCFACKVGQFIVNQDVSATVFGLIVFFVIVFTLRWKLVLIPIVFLLYSRFFGDFSSLERLGGFTFYELIMIFGLALFIFKEKGALLRTPIAKAMLLLLISAIIAIIFTRITHGTDWHLLMMNQRSFFLYFSFFIFFGLMSNDRSFYKSNYIVLSITAIFILLVLFSHLFPEIDELRGYAVGGSNYDFTNLTKIEDFGARQFGLPYIGYVYLGLGFFYFVVILKPFTGYRICTYLFVISAFIVLALSFTRGYWILIPFSIAMVTFYIYKKNSYHFKISTAFILLCLGMLVIFVFQSFYPEVSSSFKIRARELKVDLIHRTGSLESRLFEAEGALKEIAEAPFFGAGNFVFREYADMDREIHFGFLSVYINYGLLGFMSFVLFLYIPIKQFIQNANNISDKIDLWIATSSICYVLIFMSVSFYSSQFFHQCWILSFSFSLANLAFLERKYKGNAKINAISVGGI